jgi:hypothetical protein
LLRAKARVFTVCEETEDLLAKRNLGNCIADSATLEGGNWKLH